MHKYKYLLKNIGLLTISNFGTKILSFVLIPLYTSILSTAEFGTYDVYSTTVSLLVPVLTLNIIEGVMRFTLDKTKDNTEIFTLGIKRIIVAILIFVVLDGVNAAFNLIPVFAQYWYYLLLLYLTYMFYTLLTQFARGVERVADVAAAGALNSVVMLGLNILFLVVFRMGLSGYFLANCLAYFVPITYLTIRLRAWKYIKFKRKNDKLKKEILEYSRPLVFNNIAWWINNVSDRYIVTWLCGLGANGIYSVAYKIPSVLNIFQTIFNQAWTLSAVKEFDKNSGAFYSRIYRIYNCGMVTICSFLVFLDRVIAHVLFKQEFFAAWQFAPFLMISVVYGSLSGMLGGIFSAAKKSKIFARTTLLGAAVNTALNIALVYFMGPLGAAIATLVSYIIVWAARLISANKIVPLDINLTRDIISYVLLIGQSVFWFLPLSTPLIYAGEGVFVLLILALYIRDEISMFKELKDKFSKKKGKKNA